MIWNIFKSRSGAEISQQRWQEVESVLPFLDHLSNDSRARLRSLALQFISEKEWHGARGLVLTQEIQLSIALQACLPVLKLGLSWYRGWVGIIIYPGDFVIPRQIMDDDGIVHEYEDEVLGEAWEGGPVLLSWFGATEGEDIGGINVVLHEFAHKLDMRRGAPEGLPPLHPGMSRGDWIAAFAPAFGDFQKRVDAGEETELDPYASESPAEFFAVMSEAFFQTPLLLRREYPAVYRQLSLFYRQDPAQRTTIYRMHKPGL